MQKPLNWLIAWLLNPLFDINPAFSLIEAILHGFVEQNPPEAALKVAEMQPVMDYRRIG